VNNKFYKNLTTENSNIIQLIYKSVFLF